MAEKVHLNDLISQQTDEVAHLLLEVFAKVIRDAASDSAQATAIRTYDRPGRYTVAAKVVDIFGNDTMTPIPVNVG